jgi:hypothetical protein
MKELRRVVIDLTIMYAQPQTIQLGIFAKSYQTE